MEELTGKESEEQQPAVQPTGPNPHLFDMIVGSPGTGKTSLLLSLANEYVAAGWNVIWHSLVDQRVPVGAYKAQTIQEVKSFANQLDNVVIMLDEAQVYIHDEKEYIKTISMFNRHLHLHMVLSAQRPQYIKPEVRDNIRYLYIFRVHGRVLDWLKEATELTDDEIFEVSVLPNMQAVRYSVQEGHADKMVQVNY